jgi:multicomponent Na+:H+ antiporter subunit D
MSGLLALPVAGPLLAAGVLVAVPWRWLHRTVGVAVHIGVLGVGLALLARTWDGTVLGLDVGEWPPGVSIVFAADAFSALLLCVTGLLVAVCLTFASASGDDRHRLFTPLVLAMTAGVHGAYLTADLFNLFVFVEVMLAPSYVLLILAGGRKRLAAGRIYLSISLLSSTIFLVGIGLVYGVTGTVNLGALAGAGKASTAVATGLGVVLVAMAIKAGLVPLHSWLPRVYPHATPAVTALFSGLLTKVGVYAIFRIYAVVYDGDDRYQWLILAVALLSMVVGALGAAGGRTIRAVLVFGMVSHIGFMMVGPALFTRLAMAAAIFYFVHHVLVKAALLICAGAVETTYGTGSLDRIGGLVVRAPWVAVAFMVGGLSLAGVPPLSGFVAKLSVIEAAIDDTQYLTAAVAAAVGLLTLLAMIRIWNDAFWGHADLTWEDETSDSGGVAVKVRTSLIAPGLVLTAFSVIFGVGAQPLLAAAEAAAAGLMDPAAYIAEVAP